MSYIEYGRNINPMGSITVFALEGGEQPRLGLPVLFSHTVPYEGSSAGHRALDSCALLGQAFNPAIHRYTTD